MQTSELSPQQRLVRSQPAGTTFAAGCLIRIEGPLELRLLRHALDAAAQRHDVLRDGAVGHLRVIDLSASDAPAPAYWDPYRTTTPGATLVRWSARRHELVLTLPAEQADAPSLHILAGDLAAAYAGRDAAPPMPYADFAAWQNALAEGDDGAVERAALRVAGSAGRVLPLQLGSGQPGYAAQHAVLSPELSAALDKLAADSGATVEEVLLACWQVLLRQQTGDADVPVGVLTDARVYDELARVVGPCVKALPVSAVLADTDPFSGVLAATRHALAEARAGVEAFAWPADPGAHPVWGFAMAAESPALPAGDVTFTVVDDAAWNGPFTVALRCRPGEVRLEYRRDRIDDAAARELLEQFRTIATDAAADAGTPVAALRSVGAEHAVRLAKRYNRTSVRWPDDRCAHQQVEETARTRPHHPAVVADGHVTSYAELNAAANRLARHLRTLGVVPESRIGICLERGTDMIVAMLAVHKAAAAYVPIDPAYPAERLHVVAEDTGMLLVITSGRLAGTLPRGPWGTVRLDDDHAAVAGHDAGDLDLTVHPGQVAYVLHTSGSTGRPKGVEVPHAAFANFLRTMAQTPGLSTEDRLVAVTTLSFDIAGLELYLPLTVGAQVVVASRDTAADPLALRRLLTGSGATALQATPVTWRMLLDSGWTGEPRLTALIGGEALPPELAARLVPLVRELWNMYGPTETTIWSTCARIQAADRPVSVGTPIANTCVHVLDAELRPVAPGVVGELCIGGAGLARGYAGRPGLTAERFVPDPLGCATGGRLYRTGDLARQDAHGRLFVLGRSDSQVKIRGHRIELGEVEAVLARHPQVRAAVATTRPETSGELRLDAYAVPQPDARPTPAELRAFLRKALPAAMVPARVAVLDSLPLTANGKVDRAALPAIAAERSANAYVPATTATEHVVVEIWQSLLGVERPSVMDNFFDLGGHSVLLVRAGTLLRERLGVEVSAVTILEYPTIAALARHLDDAASGGAAPAAPEPVVRDRPSGRGRLGERRLRTGRGGE